MRISLGSCETQRMAMIESKYECEQVALSMGLSDTSADESQTDGRPYGCIFGNVLQWYSPNGSPYQSADCGSSDGVSAFDCICKKDLGKHNFGSLMTLFNHKENSMMIICL